VNTRLTRDHDLRHRFEHRRITGELENDIMHGRIFRGVQVYCFILGAATLAFGAARASSPSAVAEPDITGLVNSPFFPFEMSPDADLVHFTASNFVVSESGVSATVRLERSGDALNTVSVMVSTIAGGTAPTKDYTPESTRVTFGSGQREGLFEFFVRNNSEFDGSRTVLLALSEPAGGAQLGPKLKTTVTILDDEIDACSSQAQLVRLPEPGYFMSGLAQTR
jgi:hypothetical protein